MFDHVRFAVRLFAILVGAAAALPACDVTAYVDGQESISPLILYGKISGAAPVAGGGFGDRLGPSLATWTDTASAAVAPLSALQEAGKISGVPVRGPDVLIGSVAVYQRQSLGKLVAVDLATMTDKWTFDAQLQPGWIASDGTAVCGPEPAAGAVTCVGLADGKLRFRTPVPHGTPSEFVLTNGVALQLGSKGGEAGVDAVEVASGKLLYQHVVSGYQRSIFPVGADLVLSLAKGCPGGATDCLVSIDAHTGAIRGDWPHGGTLLWREQGKSLFASRDAKYLRTVIALNETTHQFADVSTESAALLTELQPLASYILGHVAGPMADGGIYVNARVFSAGGGKLCRFEASTHKMTWCIEGQDMKIRVHPNVLYAWLSTSGTSVGSFTPSTGQALASQNGFSLFFGHWGFRDDKLFEVN